MTQLHKRIERLETKLSPKSGTEVHLIAMELGETEADALARYGRPIAESNHGIVNVIFLVPGIRNEAA